MGLGQDTELAAMDLIEDSVSSLNKGNIPVFIDMSKAFDTLDHDILLNKLNHCGIRGHANALIKDYLTSRVQYVSFNGQNYNLQSVKCGVPQGSILGPLLFLIYINDIPVSSKLASFILFADDTSLLFESNSITNLEQVMNREIINISEWLAANKLSLNVKKTKIYDFS